MENKCVYLVEMIIFVALVLPFIFGFSSSSTAVINTNCGVTVAPQISGGLQVHQTEFPWLAALYMREDGKWAQACGGTLISPILVLTAAHCFRLADGTMITPADIKVGLGKYYSDFYKLETDSLIVSVCDIVLPQHYTGSASYYALDIGLLKLAVIVRMTPHIMPACVVWDDLDAIKNKDVGRVAGWGKTENVSTSETALFAELSFVRQPACVRKIPLIYRAYVTHDKFCALSVNGGQVDKGDSGGGLTVVRDGKHYVIGVVSTKITKQTNFSIFTNVTNEGIHFWLKHQILRLDDSAKRILQENYRNGYLLLSLTTDVAIRVPQGLTMEERVPVQLEMSGLISGPIFNCATGLLYWGSIHGFKKSSVNGTNITDFVTEDYRMNDHLTLDWVDQRLYWIKFGQSIKSASLHTGQTETVMRVGPGTVYSIAIHPKLRKIYFGVRVNKSWGRLDVANLDGSNRTIFHSDANSGDVELAIDWATNELCWPDFVNFKFSIVCKNLVLGTTRTALSNITSRVRNLAITPFHYYWTDYKMIFRVLKSSTTVEEVVSEPLEESIRTITFVSQSCPELTENSMPYLLQ